MTRMRAAVFVDKGRIELREVLLKGAYDLFGHQRDGVTKVAIRP
jgi:hypothetical protein